MSFSEPSVENSSKNTQTRLDVSKTAKNHIGVDVGRPIAVIEVAARDNSLISLGTYKGVDQPKGFCIEYGSDVETPEKDISTEITTRKVPGGFQYLLQIANSTNRVFSAEVRVLQGGNRWYTAAHE